MLALEPIGTIHPLADAQIEDATDVLASAFMDYPVMRYCFADQQEYYDRAVRAFFRLACTGRVALGGTHLAARRAGRPVGIAGIEPPEQAPLPAVLRAKWAWFAAVVGPQATERLDRFNRLTEGNRPPLPHFTLNAIGILPEAQGQGHGRALLDAAHALAESHPLASGVYLDTETPTNVAMYEHFGYRVIAREQLDDLTIWCMFRPNGG